MSTKELDGLEKCNVYQDFEECLNPDTKTNFILFTVLGIILICFLYYFHMNTDNEMYRLFSNPHIYPESDTVTKVNYAIFNKTFLIYL